MTQTPINYNPLQRATMKRLSIISVSISHKGKLSAAIIMVSLLASSFYLLPFSRQATAASAQSTSTSGIISSPVSFADLIETVKPAVVNISTMEKKRPRAYHQNPRFDFPPGSPFEELFRDFLPRRQQGREMETHALGSGFVIDTEGYVVTNNHVIDGADEITITLNNGNQYQAKLIGKDKKTDIALLKINADEDLSFVSFGNSDASRVGDWVVAIGNPFGLGGTATSGIISARGRDIQSGPYDDFLQIDAPINRGNSGGPLFNLAGEVIGINTAIYSPNGGSVGIGFSIPATTATPVIGQLKNTGHVSRGWLGVTIQSLDKDTAESLDMENNNGAVLLNIAKDSPAEKAGLEIGDVILAVDGEQISHAKDLSRIIAAIGPGNKVKITIWRNGKTKTLKTILKVFDDDINNNSTSPTTNDADNLGLRLQSIDAESRRKYRLDDNTKGLIITGVEHDSIAARSGLRQGDIIVMANRASMETIKDLRKAINKARKSKRKRLLLLIERNGGRRFITLKLN